MRKSLFVCFLFIGLLLLSQVALGKTVVRVAQHGGEPVLRLYEALVEAFYEVYGDEEIEIQIEIVEYETYISRIMLQAATGTLPDVVRIPGTLWFEFMGSDGFIELEPFLLKSPYYDPAELPPDSFKKDRYQGKLYSISQPNWFQNALVCWLNLDMLDSMAFSVPDVNWTWDEMLNMSQKMTEIDAQGRVLRVGDLGSLRLDRQWYPLWQNILYSFGGSIIAEDFSESAINSLEAKEAFGFIGQWHSTIPPNPGIWWPGGSVGMHFEWLNADMQEDSLPFRMGVVAAPTGPAGHGYVDGSIEPSYPYGIPKTSANPEAAWKVLEFLLFAEEAVLAYKDSGQLAPLPFRSYLEKVGDVYTDFQQTHVLPLALQIPELRQPRFVDPLGPLATDVNRLVYTAWAELLNGQVDKLDEIKRLLDLYLAEVSPTVEAIQARIADLKTQ